MVAVKNAKVEFPDDPVVQDSTLPLQGLRVCSLVWELRSCMQYCASKKKKLQKMSNLSDIKLKEPLSSAAI